MKRFAELLSVVLAVVGLASLPAFDTYGAGEEPATQGWFTYQVLHGAGKTVKAGLVRHEGIEYPDSLFIPPVVRIDGEDYEVTTLAKEKFYGEHGRPSYLHLPSSVRYVEEFAFFDSEIREIDIEGVLDSLGYYAFCDSHIESFDFSKLPMNPEKIGDCCFDGAHLTELINWPATHPVITKGMFFGSHIRKEILPSTLREIRRDAFRETYIDSVRIPSGVEVGQESFAQTPVKSIELGEGCTIGKWAFSPDLWVERLVLPRGTKLLERAFACVGKIGVLDMAADVDLTEADGAFGRIGSELWFDIDFHDAWWTPRIETVIYRTSEPAFFWLMEEPFDSRTYETATLYVEPGGVEAAKTTYPWLQFRTILPIPPEWGAVESPEGDGEGGGDVEILDLSGLRVGSETRGLPPGLYIERRGTHTRKIRIR